MYPKKDGIASKPVLLDNFIDQHYSQPGTGEGSILVPKPFFAHGAQLASTWMYK